MDQLFPSPVDDVDVAATYAADVRTPAPDRPWVLCNMISSVDGGIAIDGVSGGLGGPADKAVFSAIRGVPDMIVVASGTVVAENYRKPQTSPEMQAVRLRRGQAPLPRIAIVTGSLSIEADHRVFDPDARPLIITSAAAPADRLGDLREVADVVIAGESQVDLANALGQLRSLGANTVLLEGGPTLNGAFVDGDLIDELCLSCSPLMLGGTGPRIVAASHTVADQRAGPRPMRLDRTLHQDNFLFHRYLRDRAGPATSE